MPPDRTPHWRLKAAQLKRYEANIPRGGPVETEDRRDFPVNDPVGGRSAVRFGIRCDVQLTAPLGAFLAIPYLGNILVRGADAHWVPAVALAVLIAACRPRLRHQRRRAG
ncbi:MULTISPECIES: hypothetical protein [unclassified Streptomyces]|uniref:hypothetical protein n=1 Tax=unclassified Streptomyces TaxID=2593676 RepID=UPI0011AF5FCA|nr:hypothetical protein [Streptomyces sp. CB02959]